MHHEFSLEHIFTMLIAYAIACAFACSAGTFRMKAPEEMELTMARAFTDRVRRHKK